MKYPSTACFLLLGASLFFPNILTGQDQVISDLGEAFKGSLSDDIVKNSEASVVLNLDGKSGSVSRTALKARLDAFFSANEPDNFDYIHQGSSPGGICYAIGSYQSGDNSFRVVLVLKEKADRYLVDTITISRE